MEVSEETERFCAIMRIISNPVRVAMLERLLQGSLHGGGMVRHIHELGFQITQPCVSYHLCIMEMNGIIQKQRQGKKVVYIAANSSLAAKLLAIKGELPKYGVPA